MELARITKNGRADYFIIRTEKPEEWELLRPYYLQTSYDKPRAGRILEMTCLFSGSVWSVRLIRSYAGTADVFRALVDLALKLHGDQLSAAAVEELNGSNTCSHRLTLSDATLQELAALNAAEFARRCETA